jgi:aryl-alcohol dehydrogenase-like predicted oxidoreductase
MSLDHYVLLGRSGLRVPPFCLDVMASGKDWGAAVRAREVMLDHYMGASGKFIDAANSISRPRLTQRRSPATISRAIAQSAARWCRRYFVNLFPAIPTGRHDTQLICLRDA